MTITAAPPARPTARAMLNKVPEITVWFWVIKILCTTVGESFADWIDMTLGFGLKPTALLFTGVLAVVLAVQLRLPRYSPFAYWLTVVVLSVTGTLYTDILTDEMAFPLWASTTIFSGLLVVVFGVWYAQERTLSIHSITTFPRESFYWLAVLVTFALGTATGDWTLELTGWSPAEAVILPATLIATVAAGWRLGANPVLAFWLAYILTRPLGANMGDLLGLSKDERGLGLGTATTSFIFLGLILATVIYLAISKADVIEEQEDAKTAEDTQARDVGRERSVLGVYGVAAAATVAVLAYAHSQPHTVPQPEEAATSTAHLTPAQAQAPFPSADIATLRGIVAHAKTDVARGDGGASQTQADDLEKTWDDLQPELQPRDKTAWGFYDAEIDAVLTSIRDKNPSRSAETKAVDTLLTSLSG